VPWAYLYATATAELAELRVAAHSIGEYRKHINSASCYHPVA
jgi:hypothetical protein